MRRHTYSAQELVRAAGFTIRATPRGGVVVHEAIRLVEVGPDADELELVRLAQRYLDVKVAVRVAPSSLSLRQRAGRVTRGTSISA